MASWLASSSFSATVSAASSFQTNSNRFLIHALSSEGLCSNLHALRYSAEASLLTPCSSVAAARRAPGGGASRAFATLFPNLFEDRCEAVALHAPRFEEFEMLLFLGEDRSPQLFADRDLWRGPRGGNGSCGSCVGPSFRFGRRDARGTAPSPRTRSARTAWTRELPLRVDHSAPRG